MQRLSGKPIACKEGRSNKLASNTSKNKKQLKQSSSKNFKSIKVLTQKSQGDEGRLKQTTSPQMKERGKQMENDYGVNTYYAKYKVKTTRKKEAEEVSEGTDYGKFNSSKDTINTSAFETKNEKGSKKKMDESDYASSAFQKLKIPNNRGVINDEGKFVSANREKEKTNHSFHHQSSTKHSFSLNFTSRDQSKRNKKGRKSKSKHKNDIEEQKSQEYRIKHKSLDKGYAKDHHHSYYEKSRQQNKPKKQKKIKPQPINQCTKIASINSKATSVGTDVQVYSALCLTQDNSFMNQVKEEIAQQIENSKCSYRRSKIGDGVSRQRLRCLYMLSRIGGVMGMKRQSFCLAVHYMDLYCWEFGYQSMKLVALGSLTLALKMDDAEMISKFCFQYIYNPQRTVKKNGSNTNIKMKHKRESVVGIKDQCRQIKSKLSIILGLKISEQKRSVKQDYNLQQVLDFQTQIMLRFGFKLATKTITYWIDMLTALWDSYIGQFCPNYTDTLIFRNERSPRNFSYLLQLVQLQCILVGLQSHSKVALALAGIYLVARMALQEKKEETPWEELCRYYRVSLSKTTNLIFCDGIGINILFGDFLTLFQLSMANIIQCVQMFSRHLQPELIKVYDYRKVEGVNRQDRLSIHLHSEELYRFSGL